MTQKEFRVALRAFVKRRPFKSFLIEFFSGSRLLITHPEAVDVLAGFYVHVRHDQGQHLFTSDGVCQLLDAPIPPSA